MLIYRDDLGNELVKVRTGKRVNEYKVMICGWYGGGFSAPCDTKALKVFKALMGVTV